MKGEIKVFMAKEEALTPDELLKMLMKLTTLKRLAQKARDNLQTEAEKAHQKALGSKNTGISSDYVISRLKDMYLDKLLEDGEK